MAETLQGRFTQAATAVPVDIPLRFDPDWMVVRNVTIAAANQTNAVGVSYYWQRGFADGEGWARLKSNAANAANLDQFLTVNMFTRIDTSVGGTGAQTAALTNIATGAPPRVTSAAHGFLTGDIVRIYNATGAQQLGSTDFEVLRIDANNFDLRFMRSVAVAGAPGAGSFARRVNNDPIFYPRHRWITRIAAAGNQALVTMSVTHGYIVGQRVRFVVPEVTALAFGMNELDGLSGAITAIGTADADGFTNTITVDVDVSAFTAFAYPLTADVPFSPALVVPLGEDTAAALTAGADILSDATENRGEILMRLGLGAAGTGVTGPAGAASEQLYWRAGTSFSVDNQ